MMTEAQKRATKKWAEKNKERLRNNSKKWYSEHKEERKIVVDKYYQEVLRPKVLVEPELKYRSYKDKTYKQFREYCNIKI
jgi:hypothetical protein